MAHIATSDIQSTISFLSSTHGTSLMSYTSFNDINEKLLQLMSGQSVCLLVRFLALVHIFY